MTNDDLHEWVQFEDNEGSTWSFDVTFLASNWGCIYGCGCQGVFTEPAPELEHGCCTYGAHFVDKADRKAIEKQIARLEPGEWDLSDEADEMGGPIYKNEDGEWATRTFDDACIFLNRPSSKAGPGCALHQAALRRKERPIDWKPDVCWQLPLRLDESTDDGGHTTYILREWKRRDWGEGGAEFAWWCTDDPLAFGDGPAVYVSLRDEIVELVGEGPYARLVEYLDLKGRETLLPHPQVRRR